MAGATEMPWRRFRAVAGLPLILGAALLGGPAGLGDAPPSGRDGEPRAAEIRTGRALLRVPSGGREGRTVVIVSALARAPGPFRIGLSARAESRPPDQPRAAVPAGPCGAAPECDRPRPSPRRDPPAGPPAEQRRFWLLAGARDPADPRAYLPVSGRLRAAGIRVQVYVDERDLERVPDRVLTRIVETIESSIEPRSVPIWGGVEDIDGDGRFTVLVSGWVSRLAEGGLAVDGLVRAADFDPSLGHPYGNSCDMMYLAADLAPGPHLDTVLAHEYAHAATIGRRRAGPAGPPRPDEEAWLDEAMAHLFEDLIGDSRSNLGHRVAAFLAAPERAPLVVPDYYATGLFRDPSSRGAAYLFLRWCADRYGPEALLRALADTDLTGPANLEAATGVPFAELFRGWAIALFGERRGDLPVVELEPDGAVHEWEAAGTSSHFVVLRGTTEPSLRVEVVGPEDADLQVTTVRLAAAPQRVSPTRFAKIDPNCR